MLLVLIFAYSKAHRRHQRVVMLEPTLQQLLSDIEEEITAVWRPPTGNAVQVNSCVASTSIYDIAIPIPIVCVLLDEFCVPL